ncbi:MAG: helix-turn-helix domain-containing protein [Christensenellales bacterium]
MNYRNNFSNRLSVLRQERSLSRSSLGTTVGVSDEAIRLMEKAKRSPSFEVLCTLADYFDVSLDYLVGRSDDPARH